MSLTGRDVDVTASMTGRSALARQSAAVGIDREQVRTEMSFKL